jgi:hypothetical protein
MQAGGYGSGAMVYLADTNVLKDAFNIDLKFARTDRSAPGKTVASFNYQTYMNWGNLHGLYDFVYASPQDFTADSFTVPSGGYVHPGGGRAPRGRGPRPPLRPLTP